MNYDEKLSDIRWQKMRLKVLERDNWECQNPLCTTKENISLEVHHKWYRDKNTPPWEYPPEDLITLCKPCHQHETELMVKNIPPLNIAIKKNFPGVDVCKLRKGFCTYKPRHPSSKVAMCIEYLLTNDIFLDKAIAYCNEIIPQQKALPV